MPTALVLTLRLPISQHFSEELISTLTTGLTTLLKARMYPALQLPIAPPSLPALARSAAFQLSAVARLLDASEADIVLTEDAVIRLVPLAVGPFFAQGSAGDDGGGGKVKGGKGKRRASDAGGKGKEGLKEIRLEALGVLRAVSPPVLPRLAGRFDDADLA